MIPFARTAAVFLLAWALGSAPALAADADPVSYQDLWWAGSAENGWGMTITQHRDTLFVAFFVYANDGRPVWLVLPGGTWDFQHKAYSGEIYYPTGTPYYGYDALAFAPGTAVGQARIEFTSPSTAKLDVSMNYMTMTKLVSRSVFAPGAPTNNYSDLWWGGKSQDGWGLAVTQQGEKLFAVWYTYDAVGSPTWFVMPDSSPCTVQAGCVEGGGPGFTGKAYSTRSSAWYGKTYDAAQFVATEVGTMSLQFGANASTLRTSINGHAQVQAIERQGF